jgi:hypothetical protein
MENGPECASLCESTGVAGPFSGPLLSGNRCSLSSPPPSVGDAGTPLAAHPGMGSGAGALHLASNRAPQGRKSDLAGAERLLSRLVANELTLRFVLSPEQRLWPTLTHRKHQLESFLEQAHSKLSSVVSELLGQIRRRWPTKQHRQAVARLAEVPGRGLPGGGVCFLPASTWRPGSAFARAWRRAPGVSAAPGRRRGTNRCGGVGHYPF